MYCKCVPCSQRGFTRVVSLSVLAVLIMAGIFATTLTLRGESTDTRSQAAFTPTKKPIQSSPPVNGTKATLVTPKSGSMLSASTVTFQWNEGVNSNTYEFDIGSQVGGEDIVDGMPTEDTTAIVANLPSDGRTIYARLWSRFGQRWEFNDYTFKSVKK